MTKKFLKEIEKKLKEEEASLTSELGNVLKPNSQPGASATDAAFPSYGDGEDENAAEVATFDSNLALEGNLEQSLADVKRALSKIEAGTYGTCENCGKPIAQARLKAFPTARLCLQCKAKQQG